MTLKATLTAALPEARRISNFLERDYGDTGVVVSLLDRGAGVWAVEAYFDAVDTDEVAATIRDRLGSDAFRAPLVVETLPDLDWIAEGLKALTPVAAGRFFVHGSHQRGPATGGPVAIEIDAGQAFGTGHHATTAGCLTMLDQLLRARRHSRPLDLGTGTGLLAIALAKTLRRPVLATDLDPAAVDIAQANARLNRVAPFVHAIVADGLAHVEVRRRAPFDLLVANILAQPLMRLAPAVSRVLAPGGDLVLSGLLVHQRERVVAAYAAHGVPLRRARYFDEWVVLHLRRPHGLRGGSALRRTLGRAGGDARRHDR